MKYQNIFPSVIIITFVFCFVTSSAFFILKSSIKDHHSLVMYTLNYVHDHPHAEEVAMAVPEDNKNIPLPPPMLYSTTEPLAIASTSTLCQNIFQSVNTLYHDYDYNTQFFAATNCQE